MKLLNRAALTVIPKQPYVDWANTPDDAGPKLDINSPYYEYSVYLVDEVVDGEDVDSILRRYYRQMFENAPMDWHVVQKDWPKKRDFRMFQEWCEVRVSSMVLDLCRGKLRAEKFED